MLGRFIRLRRRVLYNVRAIDSPVIACKVEWQNTYRESICSYRSSAEDPSDRATEPALGMGEMGQGLALPNRCDTAAFCLFFCSNGTNLRLPFNTQNTKGIQLQASPDPRCGLRPQPPVIGLRSALAMASEPCQGPALAEACSA